LQTVRRLYFYLVALISSTVGLYAVSELLAALTNAWFSGDAILTVGGDLYLRRSIALNAGLLVVTAPLFLIHWRAIGSSLDAPGERTAGMRKFFLYVASGIALGVLTVQATHLIEGIARLAFGNGLARSTIWPEEWLHDLGLGIVAGLLLFYWQWVLRHDGDFGQEVGTAVVWRRLFLGGVLLVGLAMLIFGSATIVNSVLQWLIELVAPAVRSNWFAPAAASGIAQLLVGALLARTAWQVWEDMAARNPEEAGSALRRLVLYVAVIGGALATLLPVALVLRRLLLWAFAGFAGGGVDLVVSLAQPLSFLPAGLLVWRTFAGELRALEAREGERDAATGLDGDSGAEATVRRIYHYAVAATGLVLLWIGAGMVVQVLLDMLLTGNSVVGTQIWQTPLATGLSLVAVGAPVWAVHWRRVQATAQETGEAGAAERGSLPRRIYLYGVSLAGALVILFYLAQVLYRLFLVLMGDRSTIFFGPELAEDLARTAIAAILWAVHLSALRADTRLAAATSAVDEPARFARQRAQLQRRIGSLEDELAHLRAELAALPDERLQE
jgi:hypothetical protein